MHDHKHVHAPTSSRALRYSLLATFLYVLLTLFAGLRSGSLALLSESGHNLTDFLALALTWTAVFLKARSRSATKTYGYQRAGVLAAFINAMTLVGIAFYIFYEAALRLNNPVHVQATVVIWVAMVGVIVNGAIALVLVRGAHDVNIRSAFIHQLGDTLSTAAVIVGGWFILLTGKQWIDPVLSVGIGCLILWSSLGIIRETLNILLEGTPHGVSVEVMVSRISAIDGVNDVHDVHVWNIGSDSRALSCHVRIDDMPLSETEVILSQATDVLTREFHIDHSTIQFENNVCTISHSCMDPIGTRRKAS